MEFNPFAFLQEKNGSLVHDVMPIKNNTHIQSSNGRIDFQMHTDCAWLSRKKRPETLTLACLNNDAGTDTNFVSVEHLISRIDKTSYENLMRDAYVHGKPATFDYNVTYSVGSILYRHDGLHEIRVALYACSPIDKNAALALDDLRSNVIDASFVISWNPGDLAMFDNRRLLHGRSSINGDRWLKRCYGSKQHDAGQIVDLIQR